MEVEGKTLFLVLVIIQILRICCKSVELDTRNDEVENLQFVELHVITKRDVLGDFQKDYPRVEGRTFRASDPLDPNSPREKDAKTPQNLFESFETVNEIFQPQVDANSANAGETTERVGEEQSRDVDEVGDEDEDDKAVDSEKTTANFAAQYPYSEATVGERHGYQTGAQPYRYADGHAGGQQNGQQHSNGFQQNVTSQRVVVAGRGPDTSDTGYDQYSQTYRTSSSNQLNSYPSRNQYVSERRAYSMSSPSQYPEYQRSGSQTSRTEVRGPYYGGERYIDSNGHYVDAQGRHLDSTGRYYDISGRYQDAIMTGTSAYHTSGTRTSGTVENDRSSGSGYYDSEGRYISGDRSTGGYYDSEGRYITSGTGYRSGSSGVYRRGYYDSQGRYVGTGGDTGSSFVDSNHGRPVDSYGGTQFYSGGNRFQSSYDPITSQISSDPSCPVLNMRVTINGLSCNDAVAQIGNFVCYNYERVTTECCERCLQVKRSEKVGCEYGDRSYQCRTMNPFDCYNDRNRQVCCDRCEQFREQMTHLGHAAGCEYGDLTPRCQTMVQRPYLCYLPENSRICCATCPRLANSAEPGCKWGNQSPELCEPFDENRRLKIDCYMPAVQEICCSTCRSLKERIRETIPGCEYGDGPVLFYSGASTMTCGDYVRQYGVDTCNDPEIGRKCCYTCYRYRRVRG